MLVYVGLMVQREYGVRVVQASMPAHPGTMYLVIQGYMPEVAIVTEYVTRLIDAPVG